MSTARKKAFVERVGKVTIAERMKKAFFIRGDAQEYSYHSCIYKNAWC